MFRVKGLLCLAVSCVLIAGCATTPKLSPMQIRELTTRQMDGSYENIYRACITVFQDQGYIIKNTDMDSGLIVANVDRETSMGSQVFQVLWAGFVWDKGTQVEVSAMVNLVSESASEVRVNIQEVNYGQYGGKNRIRQIYDEKLYYNLFNEIVTEVKRREAMGRPVTKSPAEQSAAAENATTEAEE
jgi:hypothetical protein